MSGVSCAEAAVQALEALAACSDTVDRLRERAEVAEARAERLHNKLPAVVDMLTDRDRHGRVLGPRYLVHGRDVLEIIGPKEEL